MKTNRRNCQCLWKNRCESIKGKMTLCLWPKEQPAIFFSVGKLSFQWISTSKTHKLQRKKTTTTGETFEKIECFWGANDQNRASDQMKEQTNEGRRRKKNPAKAKEQASKLRV